MKNKKIIISIVALLLISIMMSSCMLFSYEFPEFDNAGNTDDVNDPMDNDPPKTSDDDNTLSPDVNINGVSLASAYINDDGELILVYTNGQTQNLGVVVGNDGKDGVVSGDINVDISGTGADISAAVSKAIRSVVSISCAFKVSSLFNTSYNYSSGSGVIYDIDKATGNAFIITNYHVVYDEECTNKNGISDDIDIYLYGAEYSNLSIPATFVGGSANYDLAVLYVEGSDLLKSAVYDEVELADSSNVVVGDVAIAIGNPEGEGISATSGIVSVDSEFINVDIGSTIELRVMRVDTPVNPGNSGGGLFDKNGKLIGIVNAKTTGSDNIGYAIPSNITKGVAQNIIDHCFNTSKTSVQRPLLGVTIVPTSSSAVYNDEGKVVIEEKIQIDSVENGSIAYGKLKSGDIIKSVKIGTEEVIVTRQFHVIDFMLNARVGDVVYTTVERGGTDVVVEIVITQACITEY